MSAPDDPSFGLHAQWREFKRKQLAEKQAARARRAELGLDARVPPTEESERARLQTIENNPWMKDRE